MWPAAFPQALRDNSMKSLIDLSVKSATSTKQINMKSSRHSGERKGKDLGERPILLVLKS